MFFMAVSFIFTVGQRHSMNGKPPEAEKQTRIIVIIKIVIINQSRSSACILDDKTICVSHRNIREHKSALTHPSQS